jgi:DNA polymerase-1
VISLPYREIWLADFEFCQPDGERPEPACLVAMELRTGRKIRLWRDQFGVLPPYPLDAGSLFVAYFASAEMSCHRVLGWPMPVRILDLFTEFRDMTNGRLMIDEKGKWVFQKASILDALEYFGLGHIGMAEKTDMRSKFIAGNFDRWTPEERAEGLDYCESDVIALAALLPKTLPDLNLGHALIRGNYSGPAVSAMQHEGIPIDVPTLRFVQDNWEAIKDELIARIDVNYGVYEGRSFREKLFEGYLEEHKIPWDRTEHGHLKLDDEYFSDKAKTYAILSPLRELRVSLGAMRLNSLAIGSDGRNRVMLSQFKARTGRTNPALQNSSSVQPSGPAALSLLRRATG